MRQIVLDTETTGLDPKQGHRVIEIGCLELINRRQTGNNYHVYINPEREIDQGAINVHGITNEFLADKPTFDKIIIEFMQYVKGAELIIHNAPFDVGFLNHEFKLYESKSKNIDKICTVFDTLKYARQKHPGQRNSLDALCKRYFVDNSGREFHGALLDAQLLAEVYLLMTGGQGSLFAESSTVTNNEQSAAAHQPIEREDDLPIILATEEEQQAHEEMLQMIKKKSGQCVWLDA